MVTFFLTLRHCSFQSIASEGFGLAQVWEFIPDLFLSIDLYSLSSSSSSSSFIVSIFPLLGLDMIYELPPVHCFLSSTITSVTFRFFMSSFFTLLQVFCCLPTGLLPSTSNSIVLLSILFSSLRFT